MSRYYFYYAELYYADPKSRGPHELVGKQGGIFASEDDHAPDVMFRKVQKMLTLPQHEHSHSPTIAEDMKHAYYVVRDFHRIQE
jgi:hypothetical protein